MWSEADPGAGEVEGVRHLVRVREQRVVRLRAAHAQLVQVVSGVDAGEWVGRSCEAFVGAVGSVVPEIAVVVAGLEAQAEALREYARQLTLIQHEQQVLMRQRSVAGEQLVLARERLSAPVAVDGWVRVSLGEAVAGEQARLRGIAAQWDQLVARRRRVDRSCVAAFTGAGVLGSTAAVTDRVLAAGTPQQLLQMLAGMSAADLAALFAAHPDLAGRISGADPAVIAAWWAGLNSPTPGVPSPAQAALIAGLPALIGNLNGVAFWARSQANTTLLDRYLATARRTGKTNTDAYKALAAIKSALSKNPGLNMQLVYLVTGDKPKAAIALGDLDTATHITYMVPGMGTTVAKNMIGYTAAARDLYNQQLYLAMTQGLSKKVATVAWLGWDAPSDLVGEETEAGTRAGGVTLASQIEGLYATRAGGVPQVSLVGHSMGTMVVAEALTRTHAANVVLEGSPGIPLSVAPTASSLHVPAGHVFATQAAHDGLAPLGQSLNPSRIDPTSVLFGAHDFSSESSGPLHGVTQHGPIANDKTHPDSYSYWDKGTTALSNTAKATMGQGASIPTGGTPLERLIQNPLNLFRSGGV